MGQRIEHGVASGVVGLARRAEDTGYRRKQHEEIERRIERGGVQIPRTLNLRPHGSIELFERHVRENAVGKYASRVDDAAQRRRVFRKLFQGGRERSGVGDVTLKRDYPSAASVDCGKLSCCFI